MRSPPDQTMALFSLTLERDQKVERLVVGLFFYFNVPNVPKTGTMEAKSALNATNVPLSGTLGTPIGLDKKKRATHF